jgi:hypothetical protein
VRWADEDVAAREVELADLERRIADRELLLATVRSGLRAFEARYLRAVRPKYAEVDRVEADIALALSALDPTSEDLREQARLARERAEASARASDEVSGEASGCHTPSVGLKRLYRPVAHQLHPDKCLDADQVDYRHELMVEANRAYRDGDTGLLEQLLTVFESGEDAGPEQAGLRRALWQLARAERRLAEIESALADHQASDLFDLWRRAELLAEQGRDLVQDKVDEIERKLAKARARLEVLVAVA